MKIEDNRNDTRKFSDLTVGDVFIFNDEVLLKINR